MTTIEFRLMSWEDGIAHLQGKKIIPPIKVNKIIFDKTPDKWDYCYDYKITFFDDDTCMKLVSEWEEGYYGDIDSKGPLFYIGKVIRT